MAAIFAVPVNFVQAQRDSALRWMTDRWRGRDREDREAG